MDSMSPLEGLSLANKPPLSLTLSFCLTKDAKKVGNTGLPQFSYSIPAKATWTISSIKTSFKKRYWVRSLRIQVGFDNCVRNMVCLDMLMNAKNAEFSRRWRSFLSIVPLFEMFDQRLRRHLYVAAGF